MGQGAAQTVTEIEEIRGRLERNIGELQDRLPRPAAWAKKVIGIAVGGGIAGSAFWFLVRRARKGKAEPEPVRAVFQMVRPEEEERPSKDWQPWVALGVAAWTVVKLAEIRQMRKQNKLLASRR